MLHPSSGNKRGAQRKNPCHEEDDDRDSAEAKVKALTKSFNSRAASFLEDVLDHGSTARSFLQDVREYVCLHAEDENVFDDLKTRQCSFCDFVLKSATDRNAPHRSLQLEAVPH